MISDPIDNKITRQQKYFICNEFCFWLFQLIVIGLGIAIMAKSIIGYQITKTVTGSISYQHSQQTVWLWNQGYIIDIKVENTNNCPQGYHPLVNYQWPGTVIGCYCTSITNGYSFDYVLTGQCSSELISLGCSTINAMSSQILNMWKGSSLLCYKQAKSMNFYNSVMSSAPSGGISPSMTSCALNQKYQVYTLPGVSCPITAASNNSVGGSQTTLSLDQTNGYVLNFINQTGYPIAGFKLTEYQFCDFYNQTNISPNKQGTYILEMSNLSTPCPLTDPRMVSIDVLDQYEFYSNNTRVYQMIESLPAYPQPSVDYQYVLGYIPYPSWTYQCRNSNSYNLQATTDKILFKNPQNSLVVTVSIVTTCVLILVILLRLFFIIRHIVDLRSRNAYKAMMLTQEEIAEQIPNLDILKSFKKQFTLFWIEMLLILAVGGSIVYSIVILTNQSVWIKQITKLQCTDAYLQNIFYYYEQNIDRISSLLIEASFVWGVLIICHITFFVLRTSIGDLYAKESLVESQKSESVNQEQLKVLEKENQLDGYGVNINDSSDIILAQKEENSDIKVYDMQYLMGVDAGGGQTKSNFYGSLDREASIGVAKKKKKKRPLNKKKKISSPDEDL